MLEKEGDGAWLLRGCQKRAVAVAIGKPMTNMEICKTASRQAPRIGRWDVSKILGEFMRRGIVYCINPEVTTGRLYWFTEIGRDLVAAAFGISIAPCAANVDWNAYSFVVASPMRKRVLRQMLELRSAKAPPHTAGSIGRLIRRNTSRSFNQILRTIYELRRKRLIACVGFSRKRRMRLYSITARGMSIAGELNRLAEVRA